MISPFPLLFATILLLLSINMVDAGAASLVRLVDLDDVDTPPIEYTGGLWQTQYNVKIDGTPANYWNGTTTNTMVPGARASLNFTGVQIAYWADKDVNNANIVVILDGKSTPVDVKSPVFITQQVLFNATGLKNTAHTFEIVHAGARGTYMNVDRIQYGCLEPDPTSAPPGSPPSSTSSTASTSAATSNSGGSGTGNLTAIIAGAVSGSILFIFLIVGAVTYARSRSKKAQLDDTYQASEGSVWNLRFSFIPNNDHHARPQSLETVHLMHNPTTPGITDFNSAFAPGASGRSTPSSRHHPNRSQSDPQGTPGYQNHDPSYTRVAMHAPPENRSRSRSDPPAPHRAGATPGPGGSGAPVQPRRPNVLVRPTRARTQSSGVPMVEHQPPRPAIVSQPRYSDPPPSYRS
ncbi:hypothetical protein BOTBODRAFT_566195 [Botryobasidium botryosum FD-172 SS1]|uniref:Uncharacterized protein n=1 Tax=Botryobasidium botryosum (strain FD-172 SS1) TaxID=930990 RepID=A0A067LYH9_BOTB1|nr:hypothetical protein BOTBODRAFT_566195 [Botryobasidium botryosum FD-172 SS1]